jgi:hypothetical protein
VEIIAVDRRFRATWSTAYYETGSSLRKINTSHADSASFDLSPKPHSLAIRVEPTGLTVTVDDTVLAMKPGRGNVPPEVYHGEFGIYVHYANAVIRQPQYLFHQEP